MPSGLSDNINMDDCILIDVRTKEEFQLKHAVNSINIPLDALIYHLPELKGAGKPLVLVCRSGHRSGMAVKMLKNNGLEAINGGTWKNYDRS